MGKIAFVFAGQGAQYPGMGKEIWEISPAAKAVFSMADAIRPGTSTQCFTAAKEELSLTVNTQPCLFAVDLAIALALDERGIQAEGAAGFSLGEIPALTFAGAFAGSRAAQGLSAKWENGFRFVIKRGEAMHRAAEKKEGAMSAILKLSPERVRELCEVQEDVYPVNFNSPKQTVVAGGKAALAAFGQTVKAEKGMAMPLAVSGAFHSPYMIPAWQELCEVLRQVEYCSPRIKVYANANAQPYPDEEAQGKMQIAAQVKSPVLWQKTVVQMAEDGFDTFVEVGPGKTLSGLIRKILPEATIYSVENAEDLQKTVEALRS